MTIKLAVAEQFASRPSLRELATSSLRSALNVRYPDLVIDPERVSVVALTSGVPAMSAESLRLSLVDTLLEHFLRRATPQWTDAGFALIANPGDSPARPLAVDMAEISTIVDQSALGLITGLKQAIADFWSQPCVIGSQLTTRWAWLSTLIRRDVRDRLAAPDTSLSDQRAMLSTINTLCGKDEPSEGQAGVAYVTLIQGGVSETRAIPALVALDQSTANPEVLVYRLFGQCERYTLTSWVMRLRDDFIQDPRHQSLAWGFYEPDNDVFDDLARAILENQIRDVHCLNYYSDLEVAKLERYLEASTDVGSLFVKQPEAYAESLPDWLGKASDSERISYSRSMTALAVLQANTQGRTFNEDLPPIAEFASQVMARQMLEDHPDAVQVPLNEIELVIDKVTAVAATSGGEMFAQGEVEQVRMTLCDCALENLVGLPVGAVTLRRTTDQPLPDWLTVAYAKRLIQVVNVGQAYPQLLRTLLITNAKEADRRRLLFCNQLRIQLPLKALEQKLKREGAISDAGCRLISALMDDLSPMHEEDAQSVVLRMLGFKARPTGQVDRVGNMFVIGPANIESGPYLLYQPFQATPLTEFSNWTTLRDAIAQPGALQQQVLIWLSDTARPVYANGGFDEPHIIRFGLGSEFQPLERPQPTVLSRDVMAGDPLEALFKAVAMALVQLADRESVSNVENRWANLKEGGWLLLDTLLPLIGGSLGQSAWLLQLLSSADQILTLPADADQGARSAALADLLLNVAMIVLHQGVISATGPVIGSGEPLVDAPLTSQEMNASPMATQTLDMAAGRDGLDFSWSNPLSRLTATQRSRLLTFNVFPEPPLGAMVNSGIYAGLYEDHGKWYARVEGNLFRVIADEGRAYIVQDDDPGVTGPWLTRSGLQWRLNLGLHLRGGGPKQNARKLAQANAANVRRINDGLSELVKRRDVLLKNIQAYDLQLDTAQGTVRQLFMERYESDLTELVSVMREHVKLAQEHRPGDRPAEKDVASDLQSLARQICYFESLLFKDQAVIANNELVNLRTLASGASLTPENADAYFEMLRKLTISQTKGLHWSQEREAIWLQLRDVPKVGQEYWRSEVTEAYAHNQPSNLEWKAIHMFSTLELVFSRPETMFGEDLKQLRMLRNDQNLHAAIASHLELDRPNTYSLAESISVLESALKEYGRASDISTYIHTLEFSGRRGQYLEQFIAQLSAFHDVALQRLTLLIKQNTEAADTFLEQVPKVARPGKRVIKTRGHRTFIGSVRQGDAQAEGEVVDVSDALTSKVINSWHQHAGGEWVEIVTPEPAAKPLISRASPTELQRQAREHLARVEGSINSAWRQSKRASEPEDMEDILVQRAEKLTVLIEQMKALSDEASASAFATDIQELTAAAARLKDQGRLIRIAMIKAQPPTAARINYLHQQREIDISSFGSRKNMSGARRDDFLQEFAIRDKDHQLLWWAHFHYTTENASPDAFTAAHLKLPAQRLLGYKALVRAAKANQDVVSIYRSSIGKEVAQRLFLVLTP
ncbi:dermonecrotic toxin domain-containing protein [Pseudomonas folii]|uniref:Dermonecrotic toxin N-terminal domain-containing protein n=1 Tax=Pseudomonas folii TaxID=2762593 RepID=A0ABR7ATE2_9PSED|nr:DUF6543 domain-containing protein [Pseudomonas folii]MBC3948196.1 hypothetical protein [Pseudomonas folii]